MNPLVLSNDHMRVTLTEQRHPKQVDLFTANGWQVVATGQVAPPDATEVVMLSEHEPIVRRTHRFQDAAPPGLCVPGDERIRYTYPLQVYEQPLAGLPSLRCDAAWAVPVPFHIWHTGDWLVIYGIDRTQSDGSLDSSPPNRVGSFATGEVVEEVLAAKPLQAGDVPLLEATRLAAGILLRQRRPASDWKKLADGIADFFEHCELWNPDALGKGRGWFGNMWVHTAAGTPMKLGDFSGYYDFGWGEGFGLRTISALARHWQRTRRNDLLRYVDELTRNIECFRRPGDPQPAAAFYDRFHPPGTKTLLNQDADGLADFLGLKRVWSHSLGYTGYQLLLLHEEAPQYRTAATRAAWRTTAESIARFLAQRQRDTGDIQDGFDERDQEVNLKPHRIAARAAVCGLWARLAKVTGDKSYLERALRLARAVSAQTEKFEFYNQMIDTHGNPALETTDAEGAIYALEGLVELYDESRDPDVLRWTLQTAAYTFLWTYFYDLPTGYHGVTRGGTCCRMPDYPLLYLGAAAQAVRPLCRLSELTGDAFYRQMAGEMMDCIARYQFNAPGKPWDGGMVHALDQASGQHWGPDREGQVDTGMTTGTSLIALEYWLASGGDGRQIDPK